MRVSFTSTSERASDKPYYALGIGFLALARLKYALRGYTPKPLQIDQIDQCIDYDIKVAEQWLRLLSEYGESIERKTILELGPGSDLGTGAYLLSRGAANYIAFDRHPNAAHAPPELYARMHERGIAFDRSLMHINLRTDFSLLGAFKPDSVDVVVSNAAFEHFRDVQRVLRELSWVVRPGGVIAATVDLQTHSRWIREKDPNNIYRYPEWLYRLFYFPGQPNRVRTGLYMQYLAQNGWKDIEIKPASVFHSRATVHRRYQDCDDLDVLSFSMCARR